MEVVGFWKRFAAYLIDYVILSIVFFFLSLIGLFPIFGLAAVTASEGVATVSIIILYVVLIIMQILYFVLLESSSLQGTLGKKVLGIKVVDQIGERISISKALVRYFSKFLSGFIFYIGYIMIGVTKEKQGLHDMIAKTYCVESQNKPLEQSQLEYKKTEM